MGTELSLTRVTGREGPGHRRHPIPNLQSEVGCRGTDHLRQLRLGRDGIGVLSDAHTADVATGGP